MYKTFLYVWNVWGRKLWGNYLPSECQAYFCIINIDIPLVLIHIAVSLAGKKLQQFRGPEGSRNLRFPDYMTTAQDCGKFVSLMHWPRLPKEMLLVLISIRA